VKPESSSCFLVTIGALDLVVALVVADLLPLFLPAKYPAPAPAPAIPTTDFLALLKSSCLG